MFDIMSDRSLLPYILPNVFAMVGNMCKYCIFNILMQPHSNLEIAYYRASSRCLLYTSLLKFKVSLLLMQCSF